MSSRPGSFPPAAMTARGVAVETASGKTQAVMVLEKERNSTIRPTMAGLAKFRPRPPKSCLTTRMATMLPKAACHRGMVTGRLQARMTPVTTADQSPTVTGSLQPFS